MKLQILINHYKEDKKQIQQFLKSLNMQQGVQFSVLLASDGGGIQLSKEDLNGYNFPILYTYCPHSGVCHTRNILFNKVDKDTDYVMWCDIDDMFWKPDGLKSLMEAAEESQADIIGSPYQYEHKNKKTGKMEYKVMKEDTLRVHGKIFKRQYLVDNNLTYPDTMVTSGDMAFLWLAYSLTNKIVWIENNFYIWKWNPNSVTRKDEFFSIKTFDNTLKCYMILAEELKRRNLLKVYKNLIPTLFAMIYVEETHPYWQTAPEEMRKKAEDAGRQCLARYYNDFKNIEEDFRKVRYGYMLDYVHGQGKCGTFEDMMPWIENQLGISSNEKLTKEEKKQLINLLNKLINQLEKDN